MIRNIALTLASRVSAILALLVCTPFYYRMLGPEGYALVAVSLIAHSLSGLVDAGLSPLAAAALARAGEGGDAPSRVLSEIFGKSGRRLVPLWLTSIVGMSLYNIFTEGGPWHSSFGIVLINLILFSDVFLLVLFRIEYACLQGFGKHTAANILYTLTLGLRAALGVGAILIFRNPQAIFAGQALGSLVGILVALIILEYAPVQAWYLVSRPWRKTLSSRGAINTAALRNLWAISFFASVTSVVPQLSIKLLGSAADLSRFSLAGSIANALLTFQMAYQAVLLPEFARRAKSHGQTDLGPAGARAIAGTFVIVSICGASYAAAENLLALWLGDFDPARLSAVTTLMRWQLVSVALLAATAVPYVLCIVQGRTRPQFYTSMIYFVLVTLGTPAGYHADGTRGVAIASTLATGLFMILYLLATEALSLKLRIDRLLRWALLPLLAGALPATVTLLIVPGSAPTSYRGAVVGLLVQSGIVFGFAIGIAAPLYHCRSVLSRRSGGAVCII